MVGYKIAILLLKRDGIPPCFKFLEVAQYFSDTLQIHTGTKYNNSLYPLDGDFGYL